MKIFLIVALVILGHLMVAESARDWLKWFNSIKLVKMEILQQRSLGLHKNVPTGFNVLTDDIQYSINPSYIIDPKRHGPIEADFINGKGLILNGSSGQPVSFSINIPKTPKPVNICGLAITSLTDSNCSYIANVKVFWKTDYRLPWDIIASPTNGEFYYVLRLRDKLNTRVIFFDTIPAQSIMLMMSGMPGYNINFKMALVSECQFKRTIRIVDCSEKIDRNPRFYFLPSGVPISIKCPIDCVRSWPCWGFKIYSTDSPICWAATQNFGRWGDGSYTLYKIPKVAIFRDEVNPLLNNGIYCRRSIVNYPGFTFDRKYYDFARNEYRDTMGA